MNSISIQMNSISIHRMHLCCGYIIGPLRYGCPSNILNTVIMDEEPGAKIIRESMFIMSKHVYKEKLEI